MFIEFCFLYLYKFIIYFNFFVVLFLNCVMKFWYGYLGGILNFFRIRKCGFRKFGRGIDRVVSIMEL